MWCMCGVVCGGVWWCCRRFSPCPCFDVLIGGSNENDEDIDDNDDDDDDNDDARVDMQLVRVVYSSRANSKSATSASILIYNDSQWKSNFDASNCKLLYVKILMTIIHGSPFTLPQSS